ncbi:MAG: SPFH domain-containing protein [Thermoproteota archaeon]
MSKEEIKEERGSPIFVIIALIIFVLLIYFAATLIMSSISRGIVVHPENIGYGIALVFFGLAISLVLIATTVKINNQWERSIILRFGSYRRMAGPGLYFITPFIERAIKEDIRIRSYNIPTQEVLTRDNISVVVNAIGLMKIENIKNALLNVQRYYDSVIRVSQATLRDIIGQETLDNLLTNTAAVGAKIKETIDGVVRDWGIDIAGIELQNIELPENMKRAFAIQAEAEREARAIKIKANAELEASQALRQAALNMSDPNAMQLRVLQSVSEASKEAANTIILALPVDTIKSIGMGGVGALASINSSAARRRLEEMGKKHDEEEKQKE